MAKVEALQFTVREYESLLQLKKMFQAPVATIAQTFISRILGSVQSGVLQVCQNLGTIVILSVIVGSQGCNTPTHDVMLLYVLIEGSTQCAPVDRAGSERRIYERVILQRHNSPMKI